MGDKRNGMRLEKTSICNLGTTEMLQSSSYDHVLVTMTIAPQPNQGLCKSLFPLDFKIIENLTQEKKSNENG